MGRKFFAVFLFCIVFLVLVPFYANAETTPYFTFSLDTEDAAPDDLVKLRINANKMPDTAAGFRMIIDYDDTELSFVRTETSSQIKSGTMMTNESGNPLYSVYVCNVDQKTAPVLSGNIISFVFKVKDGAAVGKTTIGAHIDEVCNYQAKDLDLTYDEDLTLDIETAQEVSGKAYLTELEPFSGTLNPEFSSDTFEYSMSVGSDVKTVEFSASAGAGGTVKINRKTLGKAGSDTAIIATVTSADKKAKAQYVITVHRAEASVDVGSENGEKPSATASRATGMKTGTVEVNNEDQYEPGVGTAKNQNVDDTKSRDTDGIKGQDNTGTVSNPFRQADMNTSDRNIYIMGNQMPTYVILLLVCSQFVLIGIALSFWLNIKPKK